MVDPGATLQSERVDPLIRERLLEAEDASWAERVSDEESTFRLRLREAKIYNAHLRSLRKFWYGFAAVSWLVTFGALFLTMAPYLHVSIDLTPPLVISYVSAFVVVLATGFASVSTYRVVVFTAMLARSEFYIERALAVASTFGVKINPGS